VDSYGPGKPNHVLDGGPDAPMGMGNFEGGKGHPIVKYRDNLRVSPAKTAEPIEMPFGLLAWMAARNHVLDGSPEVLRDVAMATNFGTKIAITDFVRTIGTRQLVMEGV